MTESAATMNEVGYAGKALYAANVLTTFLAGEVGLPCFAVWVRINLCSSCAPGLNLHESRWSVVNRLSKEVSISSWKPTERCR